MVTYKYATGPIKIYFPLSFFVRISLLQSVQPHVTYRFGIYFALIWCYPKFLDMTASHLLISKWCKGVSSPFLQNLLDASSNRLRHLECVLNRQYPVRKPIHLFSLVLLKPMHAMSEPLEVSASQQYFGLPLRCPYVSLQSPKSIQVLVAIYLFKFLLRESISKAAERWFW